MQKLSADFSSGYDMAGFARVAFIGTSTVSIVIIVTIAVNFIIMFIILLRNPLQHFLYYFGISDR